MHDVNFDEIVNFRNKEIIVYPDEENKPEINTGLNRPAEVSLERIWPIGKDKQIIKVYISIFQLPMNFSYLIIKDPERLHKLAFRDKLERLCLRMGAVFNDYLPATGTWQFSVQHFSKYGFVSF